VLEITYWFVVVGLLLITMALGESFLSRLPLTTSLLYLILGVALGPYGVGMLSFNAVDNPAILHHLAEIAVIVSLFTAGLKLRVHWRDPRWLLPLRLATVSMVLTVAMIAGVAMPLLGLSLGAAVLLGAVLAPTDPVLAAEVEVESPQDQDKLRFGLTGEAGLNDGTAFPFVMLGIGLMGLHELGDAGWRWFAVDLVWAVVAGLAIGAVLGTVVGHMVIYLRRSYAELVGPEEFLTLGLIALSYGVALLAHSYGFLAVFAAGLALRRVEAIKTHGDFDDAIEKLETHPEEIEAAGKDAPLHLAQEILGFNERLGRIGEVALVVAIGSLLSFDRLSVSVAVFVVLLLFVVRPVAALVGLAGSNSSPLQRGFIAWFGIRGIGSVYYLMFATERGLPEVAASTLVDVTVITIAVSVVLHGTSVTPLMAWYDRVSSRRAYAPEIGPD
jgi:sodium/hydrogen antiporter